MKNTDIPMINSQDMQWVIDLFEELEKGYVDRVAWHYTEEIGRASCRERV